MSDLTTANIEQLNAIAAAELFMETLQPRNSDSLDFHDLHVDRIRAALIAAFRAGQASK